MANAENKSDEDQSPIDLRPALSSKGIASLEKTHRYHRTIYISGIIFTLSIILAIVLRVLYSDFSSAFQFFTDDSGSASSTTASNPQGAARELNRARPLAEQIVQSVRFINQRASEGSFNDTSFFSNRADPLTQSIYIFFNSADHLDDSVLIINAHISASSSTDKYYVPALNNQKLLGAIEDLGAQIRPYLLQFDSPSESISKTPSARDVSKEDLIILLNNRDNISAAASIFLENFERGSVQERTLESDVDNFHSAIGQAVAAIALTALAIYAIQIAVNFTRYHGKMADFLAAQISAAELASHDADTFQNILIATKPTADFGKMPKSMYEELLTMLKEAIKKP